MNNHCGICGHMLWNGLGLQPRTITCDCPIKTPIVKGDLAYFIVNLTSCARCLMDQGSHRIEFQKFIRNPIDDFDYWGMCPTTNEPVLLRINPDETRV